MKSIFRSSPRSRRARPQQHEAQAEPQNAFFQPKLTINEPGDAYEREADAVADQVVSQQGRGGPALNGQAAVQRKPISRVQRLATPEEDKMPSTNDGRMAEDKKIQEKPEVQQAEAPKEEEKPIQKAEAPKEEEKPVQKAEAPKEEEKPVQKMDAPKEEEKPVQKAEAPKEDEKPVQKMDAPKEEEKPVQKAGEEEELQTKAQQGGASQAASNFSSRLSARKGGGSPLPAAARAQMEQGIGADFSQVRIHTDSEAAQMNKEIHAQAFTHGKDVYFNSGKFSPESAEGKRLLAHELTHVVQQGGGDIQRQDEAKGGVLSGLRNWWGDITDSRPDEARLDAEEELRDFMAKNFNIENHHPSTGRGLFNASYNPASGQMDINLNLAFDFQHGNPADPQWISSMGGPAAAAAFPAASFQWQPDETVAWKANAISDVTSAWQDQYLFHTTKPFWEALPNVHVHINIGEVPKENAHFVVTVRKWPKDGGPLDGVVPPGAANKSTAQFEESADNGITTPDEDTYTTQPTDQAAYGLVNTSNPGVIRFEQGKSEVSATDKIKLRTFGQALQQPNMPAFPVTITGHSSSEGDEKYNQRLSEARALNVSNEIVSAGAKTQPTVISVGETGASAMPEWRRVDISVGNMVTKQTTVRHEFGHMFGLGDEYPGNSRALGTPVAHSALAQKLIPGQQPILAGHNDNIMSVGQTIQPYHYVTFLEALTVMTKVTDWKIGPGPGGTAHQPGDFPMPDPNGPQQA